MRSILLSLLLTISIASPAQTDEPANILGVIDEFFAALAERDTTAMAGIMTPDGVFYAVPWQRHHDQPRSIPFKRYFAQLKQHKPEQQLLERYWDPQVRIEDRIATVWTEYDLHVDGQLSHCGFNVFNMVKTSSGWMICGGVFNIRSENCPESPLGPLE